MDEKEVKIEETEALSGEVVGFDLQSLVNQMLEEIQSQKQKMNLSVRTAWLTSNLLMAWYQQLAASGVQTIQIPDDIE